MAALEFFPTDDEDGEETPGIVILADEFEEALEWCHDETRSGSFKYGYDLDRRQIVFLFTDPTTAFEFTLRYCEGRSSRAP